MFNEKLTDEVEHLIDAVGHWQQDYDPKEDSEQYEFFGRIAAELRELQERRQTDKPPVHPTVASEQLDDETLQELIGFRRSTFEYHSKEGNKVQAIIHGITLSALLELQFRRKSVAKPVMYQSRGRWETSLWAEISESDYNLLRDSANGQEYFEIRKLYAEPLPERTEPELKPANLIAKFYERYQMESFKSDSERATAVGYFMAGAELQCFGEFVKYEDLCGDE